MKTFRKNNTGFSLVEVLAVIAVIAVLAAAVAPSAFKAMEKAKVAALEGDFKSVKTAALLYYNDVGSWPTSLAYLTSGTATGWDGPYIEKNISQSGSNPWKGNYTIASTNSLVGNMLVVYNVPAKAKDKIVSDLKLTASDYTYNGTTLSLPIHN